VAALKPFPRCGAGAAPNATRAPVVGSGSGASIGRGNIPRPSLNPSEATILGRVVLVAARRLGLVDDLFGEPNSPIRGLIPDRRGTLVNEGCIDARSGCFMPKTSAPVNAGTIGFSDATAGIGVDQAILVNGATLVRCGASRAARVRRAIAEAWDNMTLSDKVEVTLIHEILEARALRTGMGARGAHRAAVRGGAAEFANLLSDEQRLFLRLRRIHDW
jgi:hypothetical protein